MKCESILYYHKLHFFVNWLTNLCDDDNDDDDDGEDDNRHLKSVYLFLNILIII